MSSSGKQPASNLVLTEEQIDDLLYFARTGDTAEFNELKSTLCAQNHNTTHLLEAALDHETENGILHMAAANGHTDLLWQTCKETASGIPLSESFLSIINKQNKAGNTPLHWAALNGHLKTVQQLLELGADPTVTNQKGHDAVFEAELNDQKEVVEWVLKMCEDLEQGVGGEGDADEGGEGDGELEDAEMEEEGGTATHINDLSTKLCDQVQKMELDDRPGRAEGGVKDRK